MFNLFPNFSSARFLEEEFEVPRNLNESRYPAGEVYLAVELAMDDLPDQYRILKSRVLKKEDNIETYGSNEADLVDTVISLYNENPSYSVQTLANKATERLEVK